MAQGGRPNDAAPVGLFVLSEAWNKIANVIMLDVFRICYHVIDPPRQIHHTK